jgi:hypothetical protein
VSYPSAMARIDPNEARWAAMVIEAATAWGHTGQSFHDRKRHVVSFVGLGDVTLDDPDGRIARYDLEVQRDQMKARCHALLAKHFRAPPEWVTGDEEQDRRVRRALTRVRERPTSARAQARVARYGRHLGVAGWEDRWKWAADRFIEQGIEGRYSPDVVAGVVMWIELGHPERAREPADLIIRGWQPDGPDRDPAALLEGGLDAVLAVWWRDGRRAVADLVEHRPDLGGNPWVEAFALAAVAAETGLVEELGEQVERLEQMLKVADQEAGAYALLESHDRRHLTVTARSWLTEIDPGSSPPPDVSAVPPPAPRLVEPIRVAGVRSVEWRAGGVLVAEHATGAIALDADGRSTLPPPAATSPEPSPERTRRVGDGVVLDRADGSTVALRWEWDEDQLEDAETFEVTWAAEGDRCAVWGEYGPIMVFAADGSPAGKYHEHWKGPTYGVEFGGGRMMSWARDGRAVVYDLDRRMVAGVVTMDGWPENAAFHSTGRLLLTYDNVAFWTAHDVDTGRRIGPVRQALRAAVHPTRAMVGYADDDQVWIGEYELGPS